jgi:hypothetical protein
MPIILRGVYIDPTVPFPSAKQRSIHFVKHGREFAAPDEYAYERMADAFMSQFLHPNLHECQRATGTFDRIRLDGLTGHYGVAYNILTLRTFHTKDAAQMAHRGGPLNFVLQKCAEVR